MHKIITIIVMLTTLLISGCSLNRRDLINNINEMKDKTDDYNKDKQIYEDSNDVLNFYNKLSKDSSNAFVVVESTNSFTNTTKYSNGVIVGMSGYDCFVLVDYASITQNNEVLTVIDSYGDIHTRGMFNRGNIKLYSDQERTYYNEETGLGVIVFNNGDITTANPYLGALLTEKMTDIYAYCNGIDELNKVQVYTQIKNSTITYNNKDYTIYDIEDVQEDNGAFIVNFDNKLAAMYSSKVNGFIDKTILDLLFI